MIDPALRDAYSVTTTNKTLRQFAVVAIVFFGGLACLEGYGRDRWSVAYMLGGLAITVGLLGLVRPQAIRPLFLGLTAVTYPIGWVVSKVLLVTIFYGMFMPLALFFKVIKRDALARRPQPYKETYWLPKQAPRGIHSYFRQS